MSKYSIDSFLRETAQKEELREPFELENPYLLEVNLNGRVWAKLGAMIGYLGNVKFEREGVMEGGLTKMFKKAMTGESNPMMKAEGQGRVYFADAGKKVRILYLQNETLFVNGNNVLAFQDTIEWDIKMMRRMAGMAAGGFQYAAQRNGRDCHHDAFRSDHAGGSAGRSRFHRPERNDCVVEFARAGN